MRTATVHWPVDPEVSVSAAVKGARRALDRAAAAQTMRIIGEPAWTIEETDDGMHVLTMAGRAEYVTSWLDLAACAGNPDPFFTAEGVSGPAATAEALRTCAQCSVRRQCADAGAGEEHGVWGGQTKGRASQGRCGEKPQSLIPPAPPVAVPGSAPPY